MKMKHLVLGALCLALCASTAWAKPKILDGSRIGWWQFDNGEYAYDSSGYQGSSSLVNATTSDSGGYVGGKISLASGKSTVMTLGSSSPTFNGATYPYYTMLTRFKSGGQIVSGLNLIFVPGEVAKVLNDTSNWHFGAMRYQPNKITNSDHAYMVVLDPLFQNDNNWRDASGTILDGDHRPLEMADDSPKFMMNVDSTKRTLTLGGSLRGQSWYGGLDEAMVVNRMMSKGEIARANLTGETYIYCVSGDPSFSTASGWSSCEWNYNPTPGELKGAAYIVDDGKMMTQSSSAVFGSDAANKVSLTLGRLGSLSLVFPDKTVNVGAVGNFSQGAGSAITFYDLRLNDGTYTAGGTSLTTTLLDVDAPASKPFALSAVGDFALNVGEDTTGSGVLAKTGAGKLTVNKWTGTAKLRLAAGSIKTPRLDGYTDGTVLVSAGSTVAFTGDDVLPPEGKKMQIAFDGAKPTAKTAVMTVPNGVTKAMIEDVTAYDGGKVGVVTVENGMVFVEPGFPEDMGAVPVLMVE